MEWTGNHTGRLYNTQVTYSFKICRNGAGVVLKMPSSRMQPPWLCGHCVAFDAILEQDAKDRKLLSHLCRDGARLHGPGLRCMARRQEQLQGGICSFLWMAVSGSPSLQAPRPPVRWVALHDVSIRVTSIRLSMGHAMPGWLAAEYVASRLSVREACCPVHITCIDQHALMLCQGSMRWLMCHKAAIQTWRMTSTHQP